MKISNTCGYAISALAYIAAQPAGSVVSNASICEAASLPSLYVLQLLRKLVHARVLASVRGAGGGYKLARPASTITFLEIFEAIDGRIVGFDQVTIKGMREESVIAIGQALAGIAADTRKRLAAISLAELLAANAA